jgi:hypothetical protein
MGALIDPSGSPIIPFVGGLLVGNFIGAPIVGMIEQMITGAEEEDANLAYAYHAANADHMANAHHNAWGQHHANMLNMFKKGKMRPRDFEKEYMNVEQTYSNHLWINDPTRSP